MKLCETLKLASGCVSADYAVYFSSIHTNQQEETVLILSSLVKDTIRMSYSRCLKHWCMKWLWLCEGLCFPKVNCQLHLKSFYIIFSEESAHSFTHDMFSVTGSTWITTCDTKPYNIHVWGTVKDWVCLMSLQLVVCLSSETMGAPAAASPLLLSTHKRFSVRQQANKSPTCRDIITPPSCCNSPQLWGHDPPK